MTTRLSRSAAFAAPFVALGLTVGGAVAQPAAPSPPQRPHAVMGAPGGIEWNASETTGTVTERPDQAPRAGRR